MGGGWSFAKIIKQDGFFTCFFCIASLIFCIKYFAKNKATGIPKTYIYNFRYSLLTQNIIVTLGIYRSKKWWKGNDKVVFGLYKKAVVNMIALVLI